MKVTPKEGLEIIYSIKKDPLSYEIPIESALGRVCAKEYRAKISLPRFDNSAMDGYCVKTKQRGKSLSVIDTLLAGDDRELKIEEDKTVKIMTGARIPLGCEAVVPQEDITLEGDKVIFYNEISPFANIRRSGEDIKEGEVLINEGETLTPYKIALLASQGISHIEVKRKPKVAILATGSELKMPYQQLTEGSIYNSNAPMLYQRAIELGCETLLLGGCKDDKESIKNIISKALSDFDLIVTSGGVSVGEADFTKAAFAESGATIYFDKVEIKPGKPTTFAKAQECYILNLPGNPLAAAINFEIFGKAIIGVLKGANERFHKTIRTALKGEIKPVKRVTALVGSFDGKSFVVSKKQGPGMVSPMAFANGFILAANRDKPLKEGAEVIFLPTGPDSLSARRTEIFSEAI